jgi:hypothetical protein
MVEYLTGIRSFEPNNKCIKFNPLAESFKRLNTLETFSEQLSDIDKKYSINYYLRNITKDVFYTHILPGFNCLYRDELIYQIILIISSMKWDSTDVLVAIPIDKKAFVYFYENNDLTLYDFEDNHDNFCKTLMYNKFIRK